MNYEEMELEVDQMLQETRIRGIAYLTGAISLMVLFMGLSIHLTQLIGSAVIDNFVK